VPYERWTAVGTINGDEADLSGARHLSRRSPANVTWIRLAMATAAVAGVSGFMVASTDASSASQLKAKAHHASKKKSKTPCLVGNWTVTDFTLNDSGLTASGGAGTLVDIAANTDVIGRFTPGAALKGSEGTIKFSGTDYGNYGFSKKTTAKSGTFPVTYTSASNLMLSVNGAPPTPAGHTATTGSYLCSGKDLSLTFPAGGDQISYQLVPSK
jgi:hypothetical protein